MTYLKSVTPAQGSLPLVGAHPTLPTVSCPRSEHLGCSGSCTIASKGHYWGAKETQGEACFKSKMLRYRPGNKASHVPTGREGFPSGKPLPTCMEQTHVMQDRDFQAGRCPGNPRASPRSHRGNPGPEGHRYPPAWTNLFASPAHTWCVAQAEASLCCAGQKPVSRLWTQTSLFPWFKAAPCYRNTPRAM